MKLQSLLQQPNLSSMYMRLLVLFLIILFILILIIIFKTRNLISIGVKQSVDTVAFSRVDSNNTHRILVIGDSTAVGVGAENPEASLAGRIGKDFPQSSIENIGVNGSRTRDLISRLDTTTYNHYDFIVINIGGNDIVRFTPYGDLEKDIRTVLDKAERLSDTVFLVTSGDVGTSELLPFGTRWLFSYRTRKVRDIFIKVAKEKDITYIDIYGGHIKDGDPFKINPEIYYSKDFFHPSSKGYENWYHYMRKEFVKKNLIGKP